jgi:hypothetical protein
VTIQHPNLHLYLENLWGEGTVVFNAASSVVGGSGPMDNLALILAVRVAFWQATPNQQGKVLDANQAQFGIRHGGPDEWAAFRRAAVKASNDLWDHRFYLEPPPFYTGLDRKSSSGGAAYRPFVICRFKLIDLGNGLEALGADHSVWVARLAEDDDPRFRCHAYLWNQGTVPSGAPVLVPDKKQGFLEVPKNFMALAHELGHLLGLHHPGDYNQNKECLAAIATQHLVGHLACPWP